MVWEEKNIDSEFELGKGSKQVKMNCTETWDLFPFTTTEFQDGK